MAFGIQQQQQQNLPQNTMDKSGKSYVKIEVKTVTHIGRAEVASHISEYIKTLPSSDTWMLNFEKSQ